MTRTSSLPHAVATFVSRRAPVLAVAFADDGRALASAGSDCAIELWRTKETNDQAFGENFMELRGATNAVTSVAFARDVVASASADGVARCYDATTGERVRTYVGKKACVMNDVAGVGDIIAGASDDGVVRTWDVRIAKTRTRAIEHGAPATCVTLSRDSSRMYVGGVNDVIKAWDLRIDREPVCVLRGHGDAITGLAISPCGSFALSNAMDGELKMWDVRPYVEGAREVKTFVGHTHNFEKGLLRCAFSADGTRVAAGSADANVYVWDVDTGKLAYKLPGHKGAVNAVAFHPVENPIIASGGSDGVVYIGELDR